MDMSNRIRIKNVETLSDDWYILKKTTFDYQRADGTWQTMSRETYDRGNGATILLYNKLQKTVILTRQFRYPAYVNGHPGMLIEACAGLLEQADPETCIKQETEEETGYRIKTIRKVFEAFMSPGSVTEKLFFFIGEYEPKDRAGAGGGVVADGEDIGVLELPFEKALEMIDTGEIVDGKTIMLLQYLKLKGVI
ncbi:NUDIX domain-containing protein [Phormidium tenue FACHB-886]|nr:NUDIX domain-containing protein [Phormidium tenue FACHB-886]